MNRVTDLNRTEREKQALLEKYSLDEVSIKETQAKIKNITEEASEKLGADLYSILIKKNYDEAKDYGKVEQLVYQGANVNFKSSKKGNFPLYFCCRKNAIKTFCLLIRAGADINQVNDYGTTCCMTSARHNNHEILQILIVLRADINAKCLDGDTAIISAKRHNSVESFEILKDAQAYLNSKNILGESIFNSACSDGNQETINLDRLDIKENYTEDILNDVTAGDLEDLITEASEKLESFQLWTPQNKQVEKSKSKVFKKIK